MLEVPEQYPAGAYVEVRELSTIALATAVVASYVIEETGLVVATVTLELSRRLQVP